MKVSSLKKHLIEIANNLTPESTLEDVYAHLALLTDIEDSEKQEKEGETLTQNQVREEASKWLK